MFAGLEILTQKGDMGDGNFAVLKAMDDVGALVARAVCAMNIPIAGVQKPRYFPHNAAMVYRP